MKKIPTLFRRDPDDMRRVLPEMTPACEWVLAGEGVATRKYDGTCVMFDPSWAPIVWWARREVKSGKQPPPNFRAIEHDENTGKTVGWEPVEQSGFAKWLKDALPQGLNGTGDLFVPGTYELCGPKINGNPEGFDVHVLLHHADAQTDFWSPPLDFDKAQRWLTYLADVNGWEGIVWHHPDGRMAKLKAKDFR